MSLFFYNEWPQGTVTSAVVRLSTSVIIADFTYIQGESEAVN